MESCNGFVVCQQEQTQIEGIDEEVTADMLAIPLRGKTSLGEAFHLFKILSTCSKSMLPLEKAEALFMLPKSPKQQKDHVTGMKRRLLVGIGNVVIHPQIIDPRPIFSVPLQMMTLGRVMDVHLIQ